jgi:hypothetical protein
MPSISSVVARFTKQTLVYWRKTGSDPSGKPVYADPVEIKCRWEDRQQEVIASDGRTVIARGHLLLASPVLPGSLVFQGLLGDWKKLPNYPSPPTVNQGGREVVRADNTPDLKAQSFVNEAWVM